jgi:hypothetical protein
VTNTNIICEQNDELLAARAGSGADLEGRGGAAVSGVKIHSKIYILSKVIYFLL